MADPIFIERNGHRTWLKWHRGRRRASDPVFTGQRIVEGMRLGASIEVDLVVTGDKGFAVLHDMTLDRETTDRGPVAQTADAHIRTLNLRDNDGAPIDEPVMLLDDLCALMATAGVHPEALLQLDYKEDEHVLDARALENFARATATIAGNCIVSSGSAKAVDMLTGVVPGMRAGFDPSDEDVFKAALASGTLQGFVDDAVAASPKSDLIYLDWRIVTTSDDAGFDIVAAFHALGKRVDAWTINRADTEGLANVERLLGLKVDQITSDDPEGIVGMAG
ncbi:MAG: glycerophosphodiester phosphodiesterase family protein [Candidatus Devosia phytovorans]|uniref:Glycerophosphodiester phosphodiesterase family protein n=1 Tax=Candidatus Devosia phytovorans TaxID=3121372 RepID=A0AAJ6B191_9HYPH|nr:glycerophosphodiester phosphodiesterase family protein [Devosia sp.]WEK06530.1 MAG: glycerophosphodiester phosphodiesterase family protein [Devosia sp.]